MFTRIYETSLMFRLMAVTLALFVLAATSAPWVYGTVSFVHANGHDLGAPAQDAAGVHRADRRLVTTGSRLHRADKADVICDLSQMW